MLTYSTIQIHVKNAPALMPVMDRYETNSRPAVLLYEVEPEEDDEGLWCDLTVNLPQYALPGDDWAFVPLDNLKYLKELESQGLVEIGTAVRYGNFGQLAVMVHLSPYLMPKE
ncbi:hypothetical protein [Candidatus Collinsella stercoripullorum]|uniref:hypothetical protein n=1 Tax=Candidatus Collinsella stercoripullorum TaxID=2838522 RepID=UPI0022DEDF8F|nr:hypothetical protein [Candidatus Collinsella stercoripullorum]